MPFEVKIGKAGIEKELTDVTSLSVTLDFRGGLDARAADALEIVVTRKVGSVPDAKADQLLFQTIRGAGKHAAIVPVPLSVRLLDPGADKREIGKWTCEAAFIRDYAMRGAAGSPMETATFQANQVKYKKDGGPETVELDVNQPMD